MSHLFFRSLQRNKQYIVFITVFFCSCGTVRNLQAYDTRHFGGAQKYSSLQNPEDFLIPMPTGGIVGLALGLSQISAVYSLALADTSLSALGDVVVSPVIAWKIARQKQRLFSLGVIEAAKSGNHERVISLLKKGASINVQDDLGCTALIATVHQYDMTKLLVTHGANLNMKDLSDNTALMIAAKEGYTENVSFLVMQGANIDMQDKSGDSALTMASAKGHKKIVDVLLAATTSIRHHNKALYVAAKNGYIDIVKVLLQAKMDVNFSVKDKYTPLMIATEKGHYDIVKLLIKAGANVNQRNIYQNTALERAITFEQHEIADALRRAGGHQ
ncbi:ankyrin repeat domain-containing protein [Candidatus Uabimicrobium amorphum]|uniref:Ankyrin repeat domain-containing protein n=1 Tax=Uabimicrobium amorphum TaxID=2596890 RepID=A0A5S9ISV0_UABAM|nr:ankyrin repeat domain-containing protein [Candidatus Uabimicrobium amorphum]BBM86920.1 hypothetical protein UABAM_05322 [Candidatus Uabimicrobium amorphum]